MILSNFLNFQHFLKLYNMILSHLNCEFLNTWMKKVPSKGKNYKGADQLVSAYSRAGWMCQAVSQEIFPRSELDSTILQKTFTSVDSIIVISLYGAMWTFNQINGTIQWTSSMEKPSRHHYIYNCLQYSLLKVK